MIPSLDHTRPSATPFPGRSEMASLMREFDWRSVGLPAPDAWPESLKAVTRILLTSRYAMWMGWGRDLTFMYNDAYGAMTLGRKHPWALGRPAREVWAEIWGDLEPRIRTVLESGEATWDESLLLFLERSGYSEETYHTFSYSPVISSDGQIEGLFCVVTEVTERVIGDRRLRTLRDLASSLAGASTEAEVFAAVRDALSANDRDLPFSVLYVFDDEQQIARRATSTSFPEDHPAIPPAIDLRVDDTRSASIKRLIETNKPVLIENLDERAYDLPRGAWDSPPSEALLVPIAQAGWDRPAGYLGAGLNRHRPLDDSYRSFLGLIAGQIAGSLANARAFESERKRSEALAELDRAKTTFFSNVSHELRTPLTLMLGPAEDVLLDPATIGANRERASLIHRNALRLLRLVNMMLDFSRIEAGRLEVSFESTDFSTFVADVASTFRSAVERAGLRFIVDAPQEDDRTVDLDPDLFEKVILNLISNAFKHTFEGEIEVRAGVRNGVAELVVRDTGVGIAAEQLPHIFERFHRVPNAQSRTHEGTGIGLALVQELVKLHDGSIRAESRVGEGTKVTVTMPARRTSSTAPSMRPRPSSSASKAFLEEARRLVPGSTLERPRDELADIERAAQVLVVDDNADMREYLTRILSERGYHVRVASDGQGAIEAIRREPPDLVLSDIMMPRLDGFEMLAQIRADSATRELPVILLSARAGEEARVEGLLSGATDYLVKPFSARELVARVDSHVARARGLASERQASRERAEALARLQEFVAQAPAAIAVLGGPDFVYELANEEYIKMVGERDIVGKPIRKALPELAGQGIYELLDAVRTTGVPYIGRGQRVMMADEDAGAPRERFFDFVYQPIHDEEGITGVFVHVVDVTDVVIARREAETANRAKSDFLAAMSHELRTPLNAIAGYAQILDMGIHGPTNEAQREVLGRLRKSEKHLLSLVNDVLNFAKLEAGRVDYHVQSVRVAALLDAIRAVVEPQIEAQSLTYAVRADSRLEVWADPEKTNQILINLVSNATKFTPRGGSIELAASARREGDREWIDIAVSDTGIGIPADRQRAVFDPFVQVHRQLTRSTEGTGLGLAISRDLARGMGGDIALRSVEGEGSTFTLSLPSTPVR